MSQILIDTDWVIDALHGQPLALATLEKLAPGGLAISVVSYGELYEGAYHARDRQTSIDGLGYFLEGKDLLPVTAAIVETFGIVRGQLSRQLRQQIGDLDLLIGATALTHDLTLVTRNLRDFRHVPDLKLYQPS